MQIFGEGIQDFDLMKLVDDEEGGEVGGRYEKHSCLDAVGYRCGTITLHGRSSKLLEKHVTHTHMHTLYI